MPHKRNPVVSERLCGLARVVRSAAVVGLENVALWHERDISHSSAERVVIPDAFLALDYMLDRFAWLVDGLVVFPERMRRNLEASHHLFFSQRVLLALVERALPGRAYRLVQRHAMQAWEEEQDFRELVRADSVIAERLDLEAVFSLDAYTQHVDTVFDRLRSLTKKEEPFMPEAVAHVGSGKVRELYALDDTALLLVASDRISTFDVVLPRRSPTRARSDGPVRVLVRADARSSPTTCWDRRRRALHGVPTTRDAADRMRRPRLPLGLGLEGLRRHRGDVRPRAPRGPAGVEAAEPIFTPATKAHEGTTRTSTANALPSWSAPSCSSRSSARRWPSTPMPPTTPANAGSSSRTRSSSSASTRTVSSCSATRR